jgi:hypothetical protein
MNNNKMFTRIFSNLLAFLLLLAVPQTSWAGSWWQNTRDFIWSGWTWLTPWNDGRDGPREVGDEMRFRKWTIASRVVGPAFNVVADVNQDGLQDVVVSTFGDRYFGLGEMHIYFNQGTEELGQDNWDRDKVYNLRENVCFPNEPTIDDVDGDGRLDVIAPSGFLACAANPISRSRWGLAWYRQTDDGWDRHDIVPYAYGAHELFYHRAILEDLDGDGLRDLITVGELKNTSGDQYAEAQWFKGTDTEARFESEPRFIGNGGGGLPVIYDIDGDGDVDLFSAQYFARAEEEEPAAFVWFEQVEAPSAAFPDGLWDKHVIDSFDAGPSIEFALVPDLLGDGRLLGIGANHTNALQNPEWPGEAMYLFEAGPDPRQPWDQWLISEEFVSRDVQFHGAPGVFDYGDIDGDGDVDIAVAGDGDPRIFVLEQRDNGEFVTHVVDGSLDDFHDLGQAGLSLGDLNGDGRMEIVVSTYDGNAIYAYEYLP